MVSRTDQKHDPAAPEAYPALFQPVLNSICVQAPADFACVYSYPGDGRPFELVDSTTAETGEFYALIARYLIHAQLPYLLNETDLAPTGYASGLVYPVRLADAQLGALVLLSTVPAAFSDEVLPNIASWVQVVGALLENQRLRENQPIASLIENTQRTLGEYSSPQDIAQQLRWLTPKTTTCAVLLFGPLREDRPNGPFEYAEMRGSWSKRRGTAIGLGVRLYLETYSDLLLELEEKTILFFPDAFELKDRLDPLTWSFIHAEHIRSVVLISLGTARRRLGILMVASDRLPFTFEEIQSYRKVSDFLGVGIMAYVLQQQHNLDEEGRDALLNAVTDGVMIVVPGIGSTDTSHARVMTINQCFTDTFSLPQAEANGLVLADLLERMQIPADVRHDLSRRWLRIPVRDPSTQRGEFEMVHPKGYTAVMEWYSAPIYQEQRVMGRIYIFHDISAERTAILLRSSFISRVSHELRTPLSSIQGFAQMLLEEMSDSLPELAQEYVRIIFNSALDLNRMFTDVIEIARAEAGELPLTFKSIVLAELIAGETERIHMQYSARHPVITCTVPYNLPHVRADIHRIQQVVHQLLSNAVKFSPPETRIVISASLITEPAQLPRSASAETVTPALLVSVADEGPGLSADESERVFMPFYRTKDARAEQTEGSGLGLTFARSLIELHRGKLWAEPRKRGRRGARFNFTLPIA